MKKDILWKVSAVFGLIGLMLIGTIFGVWLRRHHNPVSSHLTVIFPDVGDSDCTFIQTADHQNILIDAGHASSGPQIVKMLRSRGVHKINLLVFAAPDERHIGGVSSILASGIPIDTIWDSPKSEHDAAYSTILHEIRLRHIPSRTAHAGDKTQIGKTPLQLSVLWPPEEGVHARRDTLIFRIDYQNTAFLLLGAAGSEAEPYLISGASDQLDCTEQYGILQIIGRGDGLGTSHELLRWTTPEIAVIPTSAAHPPAEITLHRLQAAGVSVWRTDRQGTITISTNGHSVPIVTAAHM